MKPVLRRVGCCEPTHETTRKSRLYRSRPEDVDEQRGPAVTQTPAHRYRPEQTGRRMEVPSPLDDVAVRFQPAKLDKCFIPTHLSITTLEPQ